MIPDKIKVLTVLMLISSAGYAQFVKGDVLLGSYLSIGSTNSGANYPSGQTHYSNNQWEVDANAGYFLNEKILIGGKLGYSSGHLIIDDATPQEYQSNFYNVGVFGRRYYPISDKFFFAIQGSVSYNRGSSSMTVPSNSTASSGYTVSARFTPWLTFFPSRNWSFETGIGGIGYSHGSYTNRTINTFSFSVGSLFVGVSYYLRTN